MIIKIDVVCIAHLIQKAIGYSPFHKEWRPCLCNNQQGLFTACDVLNVANRPSEELLYPQETMCGRLGASCPDLLLSCITPLSWAQVILKDPRGASVTGKIYF